MDQLDLGAEADLHIDRPDRNAITPVGYDVQPGDTVFSLAKKKTLVLSEHKPLRIFPGDTFFISTYESFRLSSRIGALTVSRLGPLLDGLQMTALTVDPTWNGKLLIILTNHGTKPVPINCRDKLMTICFFWAASASTKEVDRTRWDDREVKARFTKMEAEARKTFLNQLLRDALIVVCLALLSVGLYRLQVIGKYVDAFSLWLGTASIYFSALRRRLY